MSNIVNLVEFSPLMKEIIKKEIDTALSEEGMGLVLKHFPRPDQGAHTRAIKRSLAEARRYGITSFIDMATNEPTTPT